MSNQYDDETAAALNAEYLRGQDDAVGQMKILRSELQRAKKSLERVEDKYEFLSEKYSWMTRRDNDVRQQVKTVLLWYERIPFIGGKARQFLEKGLL